jgi:hypothetical protein
MNIFFLIILLTSSFSLCAQHHPQKEFELTEMCKIAKKPSGWSHIFNLLDQKKDIDPVVHFLIKQINKTPAGYIEIHPIVKQKATKHYRSLSQGKKAYQNILPLINLACITDKKEKLESQLESLTQQQQQILDTITGPNSPFVSRHK